MTARALLVLWVLGLGCGSEDEIALILVRAGDGDPLAAATSIEVSIRGEDPAAPPYAQATFAIGSSGSLSGTVPYGATVHAIARGLAASGEVVARGGSRERQAPLTSGTRLDLTLLVAAAGSFYATFDARTGDKTGPAAGLPGLTATRLSDGQVLIAGGASFEATGNLTDISRTAYLYDPDSGAYAQLASQMHNPRAYHTATALRGRPSSVLLCGGLTVVNGQIVSAATCEVFDPASGTFSLVPAPLAQPRVGHGAVLLPDTRVLITGGADVAPITLPCVASCSRDDLLLGTVHATAEVFDPDRVTLAALTEPLGARRAFHASLRANRNGAVLLAGGEDETGTALDATELFVPGPDTFTAGPRLDSARTRQAAVRLPSDEVCLFGGLGAPATPSSVMGTYECFTVDDSGTATKAGAQPMFASRRDHCAVALSDGQVLLVGGLDASSTALATAELVMPGVNASQAGVPAAARGLHACAALGTGGPSGWEAVLVVGGVDVRGGVWTDEPSGEVFTPVE
jgi:hypothetical protein